MAKAKRNKASAKRRGRGAAAGPPGAAPGSRVRPLPASRQPPKVEAIACLRRGDAPRAKALLARAREQSPRDPELLCALALAHKQCGELDECLALLRETIELDATRAGSWLHYGRALRAAQRTREGLSALRKAVELDPEQAGAWSVLGNAEREGGDRTRALYAARKALALDPYLSEAHLNEGATLHQAGALDAAASSYLAALALSGGRSAAARNLDKLLAHPGARALLGRPEPAGALTLVQRLLRDGGQAEPWGKLAQLELQRGRKPCALVFLRQLAERAPSAKLHREMAVLLASEGHRRKTEAQLLEAMRRGGDLEAFRLMARWLAVAPTAELPPDWREAFQNCPDDRDTLINLGAIAQKRGCPVAAEALLRRATALDESSAVAHVNLGSALSSQGRVAEAAASCRRALRAEPSCHQAHSNLLLLLHLDALLSPEELFEEHLAYGRTLAGAGLATAVAAPPPEPSSAAPRRAGAPERLRIGYLSPDLRAHPVSRYVAPILRCHDRARFEIFCYSDAKRPDAATAALQELAPHFVPCAALDDDALFDRIRRDDIHVLVELSGHTAHNRLPLLARKPSPVQVSWIGYFDTTGVTAIDYRLTDGFASPPGAEQHFVERLVRLPRSANCFEPGECPPPSPPPSARRGYVTFGCYNNPAKISRRAAGAFAAVLRQTPGSRLALKYGTLQEPAMRRRYLEWLAEEGVSADRVQFAHHTPLRDFPATFRHIDIALDPFPQSGETTALYTLWMGVPLVSLEGPTMAERLGSRVLRVAGLGEWVATSAGEYVDIACRLAADPAALAARRQSLRHQLEASPLRDAEGVTRDVEAAYRTMWEQRAR